MRLGILAAVMFVALLAAVVVVIELVRVPNIYAVEGVGTVKYTPDAAEIAAAVYVEDAVPLKAAEQVASTMRAVLAALKATGVAAEDIATAAVRSGPIENLENRPPTKDMKPPYYAEQTVTVEVRDIATIGRTLDALARAGSNRWRVTYKAKDRDKLARTARKAAFLDAIAVADAYAHDGQFKRGRILKIQDDVAQFPEPDYLGRDYQLREGNRGSWGLYGEAVDSVTVTGSRYAPNGTVDTTFDVPPPREETVRASTHVLFEIE
jgi:uncharacterized protein YggE